MGEYTHLMLVWHAEVSLHLSLTRISVKLRFNFFGTKEKDDKQIESLCAHDLF